MKIDEFMTSEGQRTAAQERPQGIVFPNEREARRWYEGYQAGIEWPQSNIGRPEPYGEGGLFVSVVYWMHPDV